MTGPKLIVLALTLVFSSIGLNGFTAPVTTSEQSPVRLLLGGDATFSVYRKGVFQTHSTAKAFDSIKPLIASADFSILNFENPVCDRVPKDILRRKKWAIRFAAKPGDVDLIAQAGFDLAVLANNHSLDCGLQGVSDTLKEMERAGVATAGVRLDGDPFEATLLEKGGVRIRVLALTSFINGGEKMPKVVAQMSTRRMRKHLAMEIQSLRSLDPEAIIVVSLHWGPENKFRPVKRQRTIAHALIEAGANVIMGHHTHVFHPVEVYRGGLILYSLGNLLFTERYDLHREAGLASISFRPSKEANRPWSLESFAIHPFYREPGSAGPSPSKGAQLEKFLGRIKSISRELYGSELDVHSGTLRWQRAE